MDNISDIVKDVIGKIANKQPDTQHQLEELWHQIIDDKDKNHTRLVGVKSGKLSVLVDSPVRLHQLKIRKTNILRKLKEKGGEIEDIRFRVGKV